MVLMVESICGQGFAYPHEVEEDWAKKLVKTRTKGLQAKKTTGARAKTNDVSAA
jgi:hypothetical protein